MSYRGEQGGGRGGGRGGRGGGGGRGEYYKNKYGRGGGRGGAGRGRSNQSDENNSGGRFTSAGNNGGTHDSLISLLQSIDNRPYPGYHDIESSQRGWVNERYGYTLYVGRAQSDPFARPTRCRIVVPASVAQFPPVAYQNKIRSVALADFINRAFYEQCKSLGADQSAAGGGGGGGWSGPKGGDVQIVGPNQHVLEHSAVTVRPTDGSIVAQFTVSLPARGRTILGQQAIHIFDSVVTKLVQNSLVYSALDSSKLQHHVLSVEDQDWLRNELSSRDLIAFVPNDAILPRASGADDRPMADQRDAKVIRFQSPPSLEVEFSLPNLKKSVRGMGIRKGVTLICGGGFHGKSTLLSAIQVGVYNKIPGDGREFCVCNDKSVKIRAEDGRAVHSVDISPFISNLPFGKGTHCFTTPDASGSTSQATNIVEAIEVGAEALIVDEDTCATNFMIRDDKMMELVAKDKEPITPFVRKVRSLYEEKGISSILVIGGCGDYFDVADRVVMMDSYACLDVTDRAKEIAAKASSSQTRIRHEASETIPFGSIAKRYPVGPAYRPNGKVSVRSKTVVAYGETELDLNGLEQIVSLAQTNAISSVIQKLSNTDAGDVSLLAVMNSMESLLDKDGLDSLDPGNFNGALARPRTFEMAGAINRLRSNGCMTQKR